MKYRKGIIGILPAYSIIILAVGLMNHVLVIPPLLQEAQRDAWLATVLAVFPYLIWVSMLYYIMKRTGQEPLMAWLHQHYGAFVPFVIRILFIVYLTMIGAITLLDTSMWTKVSYLPQTPLFIISLSLALLSLFATKAGIRAIAISAGILLPFVIVFGDFVMSANLPKKNYSLLLPILEHGFEPVWKSEVFIGGGLVEIILILLFQHRLKSPVRLWSIWLLAIFLVVLVLGPITGAIAEFGPFEAASLRYPAYEEWRLVSIGKYINHVDFLSIYQWLSGAFIRIAMSVYLLLELLAVKNKIARTIWIISVYLLLVIVSIVPISDMQYLMFLKHVYFPSSLAFAVLMSFILFILVALAKNKERR